ncbi:MAG TPA: NAD-dependent epimerase/dehydratase family protein [Methylomirabilota bacterium]|jgi:nucleoside-diphosphate-sugar epimerase|nr:NAD-dependent epimerase/dehydratase family protein [Methylomirabilota bacterium]
MTRSLVTGGLGFLGSHLVDALLRDGVEVTIVDDQSSSVVDAAAYARRCRVEIGDVSACSFDAPSFDQIYHLAERAGPAGILPYAGTLGRRSMLAMENVLRLATPGRTRLVYVSSSEVYGRPGTFTEAEHNVVPSRCTVRLEYALAKMLGEATALNASRMRAIEVNVVRPFNIAGPRQSSAGGFVLPRFFEAAMSGRPLTVFDDGRQRRSLTHVLDTVDSLIAVMRASAHGLVLNSGNPANAVSILDLAREVNRICGSRSPIVFVDPRTIYGPLYSEAFDKAPDIGRITAEVGWTPRRDLAQVLRDTFEYYARKEHRSRANGSLHLPAAAAASPSPSLTLQGPDTG